MSVVITALSFIILVVDISFDIGNPYVLLVPFIMLVIPIVHFERRQGFPVPLSPGFLFWLGAFLCYGIGGFLWTTFSSNEYSYWFYEVSIESWPFALRNLVLGLLCYVLGMLLAETVSQRRDAPSVATRPSINWDGAKWLMLGFLLLAMAFAATRRVAVSKYWMEGLYQHIQYLPYVILFVYVTSGGRRWLIMGGLVLAASMLQINSILLGSRDYVLQAMLLFFLTTVYIGNRDRRPTLPLGLLAAAVLLVPLYCFLTGEYRTKGGVYQSGDAYSQDQLFSFMKETAAENLADPHLFQKSLAGLGGRLYEDRHVILMETVKQRVEQPGFFPISEVLFQYVPSYFYEQKSTTRDSKRGEFVLQEEGVITPGESCPLCLLGDAYFRRRELGIVLVYFLHGFILTWLSGWLMRSSALQSRLAFFLLTLFQLRMYSRDVFELIISFTYYLPIGLVIGMCILRLTRMIDTRKKPAEALDHQVNLPVKIGHPG